MHRIALTCQQYIPRAMAFMAGLCALCAFLYGIFLLEAVAHAAAQESAERQVEALSVQVSALESQYLTMTQTLTPAQAQTLGYVTPASISTIFAPGSGNALTLAEN